MAGGWFIAVHILFPIPFLLLFLLSIPLPSSIRTRVRDAILRFVDLVLFFPLMGSITVYSVLTSISTFLFLLTSWETTNYGRKMREAAAGKDEKNYRALKWRSERNFWISLFSLTLWLLLARVRSLMIEVQKKQRQE